MLPEIVKNRMVMMITASLTVASCIGAALAVCIGHRRAVGGGGSRRLAQARGKSSDVGSQ